MAKGGFLDAIKNDPGTKELASNLGSYAQARVARVGSGQGKAKPEPESDEAQPTSGEQVKGGMLSGVGDAMSSGSSKAFGAVKGAVGGLLGRKGKAAKRPTNIFESVFIALSAEQAFEAWTDYEEHAGYMKGVESVSVNDDGTSDWKAKVFWSRRQWKATVDEEVQGTRVRWHTEAAKGTVDGVVAFIPINDELCLMQYVLEYRPKGFMEWTGNRWRAAGRRARLDVKHFARHQLMADEPEEADEQSDDEEQDEASQR